MSNVFKSLSPSDYTITPFEAYSSYEFEYVSGSLTNSEDCQLLVGTKAPTGSDFVRVPNEQYELYDSVIQSFYRGIAGAQYGVVEGTTYEPTQSFFLVTVTQDLYGNRIVPGTFSFSVGASSSYDDGKGNLIVSESGTGSVIGSLFYDKGIAVLKPTVGLVGGGLTGNGICIVSGTRVVTTFTSSVQLYEHSIRVKLSPTEFHYPINNPSLETDVGGVTPLDMLVSGTLKPYVTTIGLYNDNHELLVVAKLSTPVQRTSDLAQTFILKFDT